MVFRCGQLDSALNEATSRVRALENKNNLLEREVVSKYSNFCCRSSDLMLKNHTNVFIY